MTRPPRVLIASDRVVAWRARVVSAWRRLRATRQNAYSVERLLSVDTFSASASLPRVWAVCLLTPLPALAITLLLEFIPLQAPSGEHGAHHWAVWLRFSLSSFTTTFFILTIAKSLVPELELPRWKRGCIAAAVSAIYNIVVYGVAQRVFPVPFQLVLGIFPSGVLAIAMARMAIGSTPFQSAYGLRPQLQWLFKTLLIKTALMVVYPAYTTLFVSVSPTAQKLLVPGLPLIKLVLKAVVARSARHLTDYLPVTVILLVDVFNSLYMAVCMHSAGSMTTALTLMGVDIFEAAWSLRRFQARTDSTLVLLQQVRARGAESKTLELLPSRFLRAVAQLAERTELLDQAKLRDVCLYACLTHPVAAEDKAMLRRVHTRGVYRDGRKARFALVDKGLPYQVGAALQRLSLRSSVIFDSGKAPPPPRRSATLGLDAAIIQTEVTEAARLPLATVIPAASSAAADVERARDGDAAKVGRVGLPSLPAPGTRAGQDCGVALASAGSTRERTELLTQSLQLLFHCESLMLHRYVECVAPLVFLIHTAIVEHLGNYAYFPHVPHQSLVQSPDVTIVVASMAQLVAMVLLQRGVRARLGFSPLHQLAYVLGHHRALVQGKLIVWIVTIIQLKLEHYGTDFTFQFKWINANPNTSIPVSH